MAELITEEDKFETKSLWQTITEIIEDLINKILRQTTTRETELENKTRGLLAGGETFQQQVTSLASFLPAGIAPGNKTAPLSATAKYQYQILDKTGEKEISTNYQNLGSARASYCLQLCSLYPAGININTVDSL
ncbi:MAG: hypothetical protein NC911_07805, partial [Candidatus Omnitrophica bacterium]|nr:hypothetical protein [Candidatus Omnitrophota bacterium]